MGGGGSKRKPHTLLKETLCDHDGPINCIAVSEDGSIVATGSDDKTVRMWMALSDDTECLGVLRGHQQYVSCVTIVDAYVVSGSADTTIRKWDATTCDCLAVYHGHEGRILRIICDEAFIFSTSNDTTAKIWIFDTPEYDDIDSEDVSPLKSLEGHGQGISSIIYIPGESTIKGKDANFTDEDVLITGSADTTARSWNLTKNTTDKIFRGHKGPVSCMAADADGTLLYTGSTDHTIRCWNIRTGELLKKMEGHKGAILSLQVVNKLIYSGSSDNTAKCWLRDFDAAGLTYKGHLHTVSYIRFHQGYLFTASGDACARAYDAKTGSLKAVFRGHTSAITCLCLLENYLYTGSSDGTMRVWDASRVTLESEELMDAMAGEDEEAQAVQNLDNFENKLNGYTKEEDVDMSSKPDNLKPPSPTPSRRSLLKTPSPTLSARSRLSPSPSRMNMNKPNLSGADQLAQDLDL